VDGGIPGPVQLQDLSGSGTNVFMSATGTGSVGGSSLAINTGDYALLLNDSAAIFGELTYRVAGLQPGDYRVYCYAVRALPGETWPVTVTVDGATQGAEIVTGPMPGNSFAYLITHSIHDVPALNGDLVIHATAPGAGRGRVNGFQIVAVPEPATICCLVCFGAVLLRRKR
jgi:hypothetical protein